MKPVHLLTLIAALTFGIPSVAAAKQFRYLGPHPIHRGAGGKFCYIEFPHVHVYAPNHAAVLYRKHDGWYEFVGDPAAHGYDGRRYKFYGAHPIYPYQVVMGVEAPDEPVVDWCYIKGPHVHAYAPAVDADFKIKGDVAWYVGAYPPVFYKHKPRYVAINPLYVHLGYHRPRVELVAPAAYLDVLVVGPRGKRGYAHGHFKAGVWLNVPSIHVHVGGPGHIEIGGHHHHGRIKVRGGGVFGGKVKIKARGRGGFKFKGKSHHRGGRVHFRGRKGHRGHKGKRRGRR